MSPTVSRSNKELFALDGKKAIVTGSGGGIGSAIAYGLAEFGVDIALLDANAENIKDLKKKLELVDEIIRSCSNCQN